MRWISRLYSLQCSPEFPRVPFLRLLLAHAFLPVPGKYEVECCCFFCFFFDHRIPPCVLVVSFLKICRAAGLSLVPGSVARERRKEETKSIFMSRLLSFVFINRKKPTFLSKPSLSLQICDRSSLQHRLLP